VADGSSGGSAEADALRALRDLAAVVGPALAPPGHHERLQGLVDTARDAFGSQACSIALLDPDEQTLEFTVAAGIGAASTVGLRVPVSVGVAGWVVSSGQALEITDVTQDPRWAADVAEQTGYLPRSILAAPLETEQHLIGVVEVLDRDTTRPGAERDLLMLSLLAQQAALSVESARLFTDSGRMLLDAIVTAGGTDLDAVSEAMDAVAADRSSPVDPDLAELGSLLARLAAAGPAERRLAVRLVADVLDYTDGKAAQ
jgi:GAF domain-containing protein